MNKVIWKDIPGFEGKYQASNLGDIRSLERITKTDFYNRIHRTKSRILKHNITKYGYHQVVLYKNNIRNRYSVHRLISLTFIENPNNLPCVNHIDENKDNNAVSNLEWCTNKYNSNYGTATNRTAAKVKKSVIQLTKEQTIINEFSSATEASNITGISRPSIVNCCKKIYKTAGGFIWRYKE